MTVAVKQLYRARIIPLYVGKRQEDKAFWAYRHALSQNQAALFLGRQYPYPEYYIEQPELDPRRNVVRRTSPQLDAFVNHLGYVSVNIPTEDGLKTDAELVQESQERLSRVKVIPDHNLSEAQRVNLSLVREIISDITSRKVHGIHAADIPPASDRVTTAGMYGRNEEVIFISPIQLMRGRTSVDTGVHELSHHTSGAEDGEPEHQAEIARLGGEIVARTRSGRYDRIIAEPAFVW
jgi:hypothetical protein